MTFANTSDTFRADTRQNKVANRLAEALAQGGLTLVYQPEIDLVSREVTSLEALCRWHDEELGQVAPDEFIAVAEARGLIVQIGQYLLNQVLADLPLLMQRWPQRVIAIGFILGALVVIWATNSFLTERFTESTRNRAALRQALYSGQLLSELQRTSVVPLLLARDPELISALVDSRFVTTSQRLISAQQSMERDYLRLRHVETRYRLLFQVASDAVLVLEPEPVAWFDQAEIETACLVIADFADDLHQVDLAAGGPAAVAVFHRQHPQRDRFHSGHRAQLARPGRVAGVPRRHAERDPRRRGQSQAARRGQRAADRRRPHRVCQ